MKKIVFLMVIFCLFSFTTTNATEWVFVEDEYTIKMNTSRDYSGHIVYDIEKLGTNPFQFNWAKEGYSVYFTGVKEVNGNHVFFGSLNDSMENDRVYDGYVLIVSEVGEVLDEFTVDCGHDEHILKVFEVNEMIMFQIWSNDQFDRGQLQFFTELRRYDYQYNYVDSVRIEPYFSYSHIENGFFVFGNGEQHNLGIVDSELNVYFESENLDIPNNQSYEDKVVIPTVNNAYLNGEVVPAGLVIDYPGIYQLTYNDFTYRFTVDVTIEGIENGAVYDAPVTPIIKTGNVTINGESYVSGTEINKPGTYNISVTGNGGYIVKKSFTISSNVNGVLNNQTYEEVDISFEGEGYLNNVHMSSPIKLSDPGEYILKIQGENDYLESYFFKIEENVEEKTFLDIVQTYDIVVLGIVMVASFFILKKKK